MLGAAPVRPRVGETNANAACRQLRSFFIRGSIVELDSRLDHRGPQPDGFEQPPRPLVSREHGEQEAGRTEPARRFDETPSVRTSANRSIGMRSCNHAAALRKSSRPVRTRPRPIVPGAARRGVRRLTSASSGRARTLRPRPGSLQRAQGQFERLSMKNRRDAARPGGRRSTPSGKESARRWAAWCCLRREAPRLGRRPRSARAARARI